MAGRPISVGHNSINAYNIYLIPTKEENKSTWFSNILTILLDFWFWNSSDHLFSKILIQNHSIGINFFSIVMVIFLMLLLWYCMFFNYRTCNISVSSKFKIHMEVWFFTLLIVYTTILSYSRTGRESWKIYVFFRFFFKQFYNGRLRVRVLNERMRFNSFIFRWSGIYLPLL